MTNRPCSTPPRLQSGSAPAPRPKAPMSSAHRCACQGPSSRSLRQVCTPLRLARMPTILRTLWSATEKRNFPNSKLGQKCHPDTRIPPTAGDQKNTLKNQKNSSKIRISFLFLKLPGGASEGVFRESPFFWFFGGYF